MRENFFFVVLGLCFFVGCQNKGIIEIKNSTHRDVTFRIIHQYGEEYFKEIIETKKGETVSREVVLKTIDAPFVSRTEMPLAIFEDGKGYILDTFILEADETEKVEIIGYYKNEPPDPRLVGEWVYADKPEDKIKFENNNKCKITDKLMTYGFRYRDYDYEEWKIEDDKIMFREWLDISSSDNNIEEHKWKKFTFEYIDSSTVKIWGVIYKKN